MQIYDRRIIESYIEELYKSRERRRSDVFIDFKNIKINNRTNIKPIAFYLPQFYPTVINDKNWGKGFTEWNNVTSALPQFIGHYQPHFPERFGYYDLRNPNILLEQSQLAQNYGIQAFCFYYYYFQGKTELEAPIITYNKHTDIELPFCLCWANENWTRRWDGQNKNILLEQKYDVCFQEDFMIRVTSYFQSEKYLRINDRPVFLIYNAAAIPDISSFIDKWREYCYRKKINNPYFIAARTFTTDFSILSHGIDELVEFPPHGIKLPPVDINSVIVNSKFCGKVYNIKQWVDEYIPEKRIIRGVFPSWDNTSRMQHNAKIFIGTLPSVFEHWCDVTIRYTVENYPENFRLLFINAWNEWGEGAHLEPDKRFGYAYLQALANSINKG